MTPPQKATPGGNRADAEETTEHNVVSLRAQGEAGNAKTGRTRYMRLFPERFYFAIENLTEREMAAWLRLTMAFVTADGALPADDKRLAAITKTGKRWPELRDKLSMLGLGRVANGHWIDDDQNKNLQIQRRSTERALRANAVRWGKRDA